MNLPKKKRSENWSTEEKNVLRELIAQSREIIEHMGTSTSSNMRKAQEWKNVAHKLNALMGKNRSEGDVKLAWKRMKLVAKANLSTHRQQQIQTGGGKKPKSPSQEDLAIMDIAPHDFIIEYNNYDSDAVLPTVQISSVKNEEAGPSMESNKLVPTGCNDVVEVVTDQGSSNANVVTATTTPKKQSIHRKKCHQNTKTAIQESILESNTQFKKKQIEMLEVEHKLNIEIARLKIKKLELEIQLLEKTINL